MFGGHSRKKIDFIGIGAGKAGTTWLWYGLRQHPGIFMPDQKELHYFNMISFEDDKIRNPRFDQPLSWYLDYFSAALPSQICGEITPIYYVDESAPARIFDCNPSAKIIFVVRDPIDRTFSEFLYRHQRGVRTPEDFDEAIRELPFLIERSLYAKALKRYLCFFPIEQIHILLYDAITTAPEKTLGGVVKFLGLKPLDHMLLIAEKKNETGRPRYPTATKLLRSLRTSLKRLDAEWLVDLWRDTPIERRLRSVTENIAPFDARPVISVEARAYLRDIFRSDIVDFEHLTGIDLASWKER